MMGRFVAVSLLLIGYFTMPANSVAAPAPAPAPTTLAPGPLRCQEDDRTLLPSATVCTDDIGSCALIFGAAAKPGGNTRPVLCDNDDLQDVASQCARTCGICCEKPEYDCEDSRTSPINCTMNKRYCDNANWTTVMTTYCPQSCGLCNSGSGCRDLVSGCHSMASLCENINFYQYMQTNCRRSCGLCTSGGINGTCNDVAANCANNAGLCNNPAYYDLMTQKCGKTCGRCGASSGGVGTGSCIDSSPSCRSWVANGFCTNAFYTPAQRRQSCAKSCGLC